MFVVVDRRQQKEEYICCANNKIHPFQREKERLM